MQIFPVVLRRFWNEWEIQALVLISFIIQIILTVMGNRQKYLTGDKLSFILWFAYLSLDWFAAFSLSVLSKNAGNFKDPKFSIKAFWAQFFLLYLGGPDTITAYSMEDNELWRRKFLMLGFQVIIAFYISLKASNQTLLSKLAFPIFIAGIIKIGERIWVLRSASSEKFKASMLHRPDPGPNYARYMEEYCSKKDEGFEVTSGRFMEAPVLADLSFTAPKNVMITDGATLQDAYIFFMTFKQLFADLILSVQDKVNSQSFFKSASCDEAFKVIEVELGFMYDVFYTKAFKVYSVTGCIFRLISFSCTVSILCIFSIMEKPAYSRANVIITYVLLGGATILEIYAVLLLIISDWTKLWLSNKHKNAMVDLLYGGISLFDSIPLFGNKRWSQTMGQYNLIEFCLKVRPAKCSFLQKVLCINEWFEKHRYQDSVDVSMSLKELIFQQLVEKSRSASDDLKDCKDLCASRGDRVLSDPRYLNEISKENLKTLKDSVEVEFDQSILLWHIATNLCYNYDQNTTQNPDSSPNCEASKLLSDYMLYLLVMLPVMLPNGIEQIRFQDTCAEASEFFEERNSISDVKQACMIIHQVSTEIPPSEVKGDRSKSVLFDGCRLAKSLQSLGIERKWELISHVWVEMLCYAASKCRWNHHAQQLTHGGELLTHVWLLMAHLGITEQFQISKGHARARLIVH